MIPRTLFDADHEVFRTTVQRFIAEHVTPHHAQWEKEGEVPRELWREAAQAGLLCCNVSTDYGGMGGDFLHSTILIEEFARAGATGPTFYLHSDIVAPIWWTSVPRNRNAPGSHGWHQAKWCAHWG